MVVRLFRTRLLPPGCRKGRAVFRRACRLALGRRTGRRGEINVIFTTNPDIRRINRRFLRHDRSTDVIAFAYDEESSFGDIYISVDQARRQAKELGHSLLEELLTLAVHGMLHLLGYDDHAPRARARMFMRQTRVVKSLLPAP